MKIGVYKYKDTNETEQIEFPDGKVPKKMFHYTETMFINNIRLLRATMVADNKIKMRELKLIEVKHGE